MVKAGFKENRIIDYIKEMVRDFFFANSFNKDFLDICNKIYFENYKKKITSAYNLKNILKDKQLSESLKKIGITDVISFYETKNT